MTKPEDPIPQTQIELQRPPDQSLNSNNNHVVGADGTNLHEHSQQQSNQDDNTKKSPSRRSQLIAKPLLISVKLFAAILLTIFLSGFLSLTYLSGLTKRSSIGQSVNYVPTLQSGYASTRLNLTSTIIAPIELIRASSTIPSNNPFYQSQSHNGFYQIATKLPKKQLDKLTIEVKNRQLAIYNATSHVFGFSSIIGMDGLPMFSFVGTGCYLYILHCENLMCTESTTQAIDLSLFKQIYDINKGLETPNNEENEENEENRMKQHNTQSTSNTTTQSTFSPTSSFINTDQISFIMNEPIIIPQPEVKNSLFWFYNDTTTTSIHTYLLKQSQSYNGHSKLIYEQYPSDIMSQQMFATTEITLSSSLRPIVLASTITGQLFLTVCSTADCRDSVQHITLLHSSVDPTSVSLKLTPFHLSIVFATKSQLIQLPSIQSTQSFSQQQTTSTTTTIDSKIDVGSLFYTFCKDADCVDFYYQGVSGLFVRKGGSITLNWQISTGLTTVFPGYWLYTPIPTLLLQPFIDFQQKTFKLQSGQDGEKNSEDEIIHSTSNINVTTDNHAEINITQDSNEIEYIPTLEDILPFMNQISNYSIFLTRSMHPLMAIGFTHLSYQQQWFEEIYINDAVDHYKFKCDPFSEQFIRLIKGLIIQFYEIDYTAGYNGDQPHSFQVFDDTSIQSSLTSQSRNKINLPPIYTSSFQQFKYNNDYISLDEIDMDYQLSNQNNHHNNNNNDHNTNSQYLLNDYLDQTMEQLLFQQDIEMKKLHEFITFQQHVQSNPTEYSTIQYKYNVTQSIPNSNTTIRSNLTTSTTNDESFSSTATPKPKPSITPPDDVNIIKLTYPNGDFYQLNQTQLIPLATITPIQFDSIFTSILTELQNLIVHYTGLPSSYYQVTHSKILADGTIEEIIHYDSKIIYTTCTYDCRPGNVVISLPLESNSTSTTSSPTSSPTTSTPIDTNLKSTTTTSQSTDSHSSTHSSTESTESTESTTNDTINASTTITPINSTQVGHILHVFSLDTSSNPTIFILANEDEQGDSETGAIRIEKQKLLSFRCPSSDCRKLTSKISSTVSLAPTPTTLTTSMRLHANTTIDPEYYTNHIFGGAIDSIVPILSNMTNVTHITADSDPFFPTFQYLLFDVGTTTMYSRCFDIRCTSMHAGPLIPTRSKSMLSNLSNITTTQLFSPTTSLIQQFQENDQESLLQYVLPSMNLSRPLCTSKPCFNIIISPIDSMILIIAGNVNPVIIHCSNMFCVPYLTP